MRTIDTKHIKRVLKEALKDIAIIADPQIKQKLTASLRTEENPLAKEVLTDMLENFEIAEKKALPICQDTGMAIIFIELGQDVRLEGPFLYDMVNEAVREAYGEAYLRKSVVDDPLRRENTKDNTPAVIHLSLVEGDGLKIDVIAKGFGSENTSKLAMLKPADGVEGVKEFIIDSVKEALPNGCAPLVVGVGIGGDFESCAINAKKALSLPLNYKNNDPFYAKLEEELLKELNNTGIGPMGLGGSLSVMELNILPAPTHIAGLPVAVNVCCYVDRHKQIVL